MTKTTGLNYVLPADTSGFVYLRESQTGPRLLEATEKLEEMGFSLIETIPILSASVDDSMLNASLILVESDAEITDKQILKILLDDAVAKVGEGKIKDLPSIAAILKTERFKLLKKEVKILYQDEYCVAVNKPSGLLVHRTSMTSDNDFLLQRVREQTGKKVYPVHRLDRATSGVVLFAFGSDRASEFFRLFRERNIKKSYWAVARGHTEDANIIDSPLKSESGKSQEAITEYETLSRTELQIPVGPYQTSRYSLVKVNLKTGRNHQIRRHFAHIRHPLVGDTAHGDGRHNKMFRHEFSCHRLLLAAVKLEFKHPFTDKIISIKAPLGKSFVKLLEKINLLPPNHEN